MPGDQHQSDTGQLFELRTAGNIVPPFASQHPTSEACTIEYAVEVLGVSDIVVCGHSHCGAVGALVRGDDLTAVPAVRDWLTHATPRPAGAVEDPAVSEGVQSHVLTQLLRLRSYPYIEKKLKDRQLSLHAWFYEVHTGAVLTHDPATDTFKAL